MAARLQAIRSNLAGQIWPKKDTRYYQIEVLDGRTNPRRAAATNLDIRRQEIHDSEAPGLLTSLPGVALDQHDNDNDTHTIDDFIELLSQAADRLFVRKDIEASVDSISKSIAQRQKTLEEDKIIVHFLQKNVTAMPELKSHLECMIGDQVLLQKGIIEARLQQKYLKDRLERSRQELSAHMKSV